MASHVQPLVLDCRGPSPDEVDAASLPQACLLCAQRFNISGEDIDSFLRHLLETHKLVIGDVEQIADLQRYVEYWRPRLAAVSLKDVCVTMADGPTSDGEGGCYYMLCPVLKEDKQLRSELQRHRLQRALDAQQAEREDDSTSWTCLFCNEPFTGNRSLVLNHMNKEHNFNIGHPDNLVNVGSFVRKLQDKLERLLCLYCEKTFKDKFTLKEHMRKKQHKRLNPANQDYDAFYLVNYLELGKDYGPKRVTRRGRGGVIAYVTSGDSDAEDDWIEREDTTSASETRAVCLFCKHTEANPACVFNHLRESHQFDFSAMKRDLKLNFYHQVKIVNYIRRQVLERRCVQCLAEYEDNVALLHHHTQSGHMTSFVEDRGRWDHPEYYFPTYENDSLLSGLDCETDAGTVEDWVIPEDAPQFIAEPERLASLMQDVMSSESTDADSAAG